MTRHVFTVEEILQFPDNYHTKGVLSLPYGDIVEPFEAWYSNSKKMSRIDYYNGMIYFIYNFLRLRHRLDQLNFSYFLSSLLKLKPLPLILWTVKIEQGGGPLRLALAYICHALCLSIRQYVSHVRVTTSEKLCKCTWYEAFVGISHCCKWFSFRAFSLNNTFDFLCFLSGMDRTFQRGDLGRHGFACKIVPEYSEVKHKTFTGCMHRRGTKKFPIKAQNIIPAPSYFKVRSFVNSMDLPA